MNGRESTAARKAADAAIAADGAAGLRETSWNCEGGRRCGRGWTVASVDKALSTRLQRGHGSRRPGLSRGIVKRLPPPCCRAGWPRGRVVVVGPPQRTRLCGMQSRMEEQAAAVDEAARYCWGAGAADEVAHRLDDIVLRRRTRHQGRGCRAAGINRAAGQPGLLLRTTPWNSRGAVAADKAAGGARGGCGVNAADKAVSLQNNAAPVGASGDAAGDPGTGRGGSCEVAPGAERHLLLPRFVTGFARPPLSLEGPNGARLVVYPLLL